jgi:asparagine synthase (glutamine-hydrolysing)
MGAFPPAEKRCGGITQRFARRLRLPAQRQASPKCVAGRARRVLPRMHSPPPDQERIDQTMCGIAGLMLAGPASAEALAARVAPMNAALVHRGPDGEGIWTEPEAGVALAQRRLAIVDLSPTGAQPMLSASGRLAMTYNGEIYNFRELRAELEALGHRFRGTSDSEVLIEAWERWGGEKALDRLNGMFAIAMFDRKARTLTLARDRMGIKPLLYARTPSGLFFGSELKALSREPSMPRDIDPSAVTALLRNGYVPAPWTIIRGVRKLEPGVAMTWPADGGEPETRRFWSPASAAEAGQAAPSDAPWETLVDEGEALIGDAVERQMIADVPLGAFLSGGVDSSLVAALMQKGAGRKVDTFTIGFAEKAWDESSHAAAVAAHIGTNHHTLTTSGRAALDLVAEIGGIYDEPFADSSQLPTVLLSRLVRQHVTVALSGDGGDETFAGYQRYDWGLRLATAQARVPATLRMAALAGVRAVPAGLLRKAAAIAGRDTPHAGHKLKRLATLVAAPGFVAGYRQFLSLTNDPETLVTTAGEHAPAAHAPETTAALADPLARMQLTDALSYLPDDILTKTDRASMSAGLEVRVPLLDHRIWEWAMRIPVPLRRRGGAGKALLKAVLARHLPPALTERPKAGFAVPLADWLRTDLRDFAEAGLSAPALIDAGVFDAPAVRRLWAEHLAGRHDHGPVLWAVLMFQSWRHSWRAAVHG